MHTAAGGKGVVQGQALSQGGRIVATYFISFNTAELDWADWIAWLLEERGQETIIQEWDFVPAETISLRTDEAAAKADKIIAILSPAYLETLAAQPEWAADFARDAGGADRKVIPVRVKECFPEEIINDITYIDLTGLDEEKAEQELLHKIAAEGVKH